MLWSIWRWILINQLIICLMGETDADTVTHKTDIDTEVSNILNNTTSAPKKHKKQLKANTEDEPLKFFFEESEPDLFSRSKIHKKNAGTTKRITTTKKHRANKKKLSHYDVAKKPLVKCSKKALSNPMVRNINDTALDQFLKIKPNVSRYMEADCVLVLFYGNFCPFSASATPHFYALSKMFPNIRTVAVDVFEYEKVRRKYTIAGVPIIKLFHNGFPVARFKGSNYKLASLVKFIHGVTGQTPKQKP